MSATPASATVCGLVGKLPAHGDFVRRGQPKAALARLDQWLDAELGGAVAAGIVLEDAVDALDGWRFAVPIGDGAHDGIIVVAVASVDRVGRRFPLLGLLSGLPLPLEAAEAWCAAAEAALGAVRDAGGDADAALAALNMIRMTGGARSTAATPLISDVAAADARAAEIALGADAPASEMSAPTAAPVVGVAFGADDHAAKATPPADTSATPPLAGGWWREGDVQATGADLPVGEAFRALLEARV